MSIIRDFFSDLRESIRPGGPSTTKIIYLATGWLGLLSAVVMTATFCAVYALKGTADASFAGALSALWVAAYGFNASAQNAKARADTELALGGVAGADKP